MIKFRQLIEAPETAYHYYQWEEQIFDSRYPNYTACAGFHEAVAAMEQNNVHVVPYTNGRLMDLADGRWAAGGSGGACHTIHGDLYNFSDNFAFKNKLDNITWEINRTLAVMDAASPFWHDVVSDVASVLTHQHNTSGIYLDCVASGWPEPCFSSSKGGEAGAAWADGRRAMLSECAAKAGPEKVVISESNDEAYMADLNAYLAIYGYSNCGAVPAFQAVYGGYAVMVGLDGPSAVDDIVSFRAKFALAFTVGNVLGWGGGDPPLEFLENSAADVAYIQTLVRLRLAHPEYLVHGRLMRPPVLLSYVPSILICNASCKPAAYDKAHLECGRCGHEPCATPAVVSQAWMAKDGKMAVFLANFGVVDVTNYTARVDITNYSYASENDGSAYARRRGRGQDWTVISTAVHGLDAAVIELPLIDEPDIAWSVATTTTTTKSDDDAGFTIDNLHPRRDTSGRVIDAHSGNILQHETLGYFLYGDHYKSTDCCTKPHGTAVYTSPDMVRWTRRAEMIFVNGSHGNFSSGSYYTPAVIWDAPRSRFLAWVSFFAADGSSGCLGKHCPPPRTGCPAGWYVAESRDGVSFAFVAFNCDGVGTNMNAILQDVDGKGYMAYRRPSRNTIYIASLSDDYERVSNFSITLAPLPEEDTEGLALFLRGGTYYLLQGSCCCQCTWGSNLLVYSAASVFGPWVRRGDINPVRNASDATHCQLQCHSSAETGARRCDHTIHGQLNAVGQLRSATGELTVLALIDRWMSAPGANPRPDASNCVASSKARNAPGYVHGDDYQYWAPLQFEADGNIAPLPHFQDRIFVPMKTSDDAARPAPAPAWANGCEWNVGTCLEAAAGGHLEALQWARANGCA
jgi:hypothetical protein